MTIPNNLTEESRSINVLLEGKSQIYPFNFVCNIKYTVYWFLEDAFYCTTFLPVNKKETESSALKVFTGQ